jgi:hypothetical protein
MVLASKLQKSQEPISQPNLKLPHRSQVNQITKSPSILPGDSHSPKLQDNKEEQQIQDRLIRNEQQHCPPIRFPASQELMQPKDKFSGKCQYQIKETYGSSQPTHPSILTCEGSKGVQKVTSTCSGRTSKKGLAMIQRDDPHEDIKKDLRRDPEGLYLSSESPSLVCLKENSENCLVRSSKCFSGTHLSTNPDREHLAKTLQVHLSRKVELMKEGTIPLCVRRS